MSVPDCSSATAQLWRSTWGVIRWRAVLNGGQIEVSTRSGNTSTPDETWSAWSKEYTTATGEQIASPNARYLQWRITMSAGGGSSPVPTSVTAAYLPRNLRQITLVNLPVQACSIDRTYPLKM